MEVPEASLDADSQAQRLQHAKLEQVLPHLCTLCVCVQVPQMFCGRQHNFHTRVLQTSQLPCNNCKALL